MIIMRLGIVCCLVVPGVQRQEILNVLSTHKHNDINGNESRGEFSYLALNTLPTHATVISCGIRNCNELRWQR